MSHLGHGVLYFSIIVSSLFSAWDWDTPKSMCDIIQDDIRICETFTYKSLACKPPFGIYQVSNLHHLSDSVNFHEVSKQNYHFFSHGNFPPFAWSGFHRVFWEGHESCRGSHLGSFLVASTLL